MINDATIVIPTLHRSDCLRSLLLKISRLPTLPKEIMVVEQGASQDLREEFSQLKDVGVKSIYVITHFKSAAFVRNIGLILANSSQLIYLEDDVEPESDIVSEFEKALREHGEVNCAAGHLICRHPVEWVGVTNTLQPTETYLPHGMSGNVVFRRDSLLELGGFNCLFPIRAKRPSILCAGGGHR